MAVLELTKEQVFELVRQMPAEEKREMLHVLAMGGSTERAKRQQFAEEQLRRVCAGRGLNWDALSADERESFINDLIHEDRTCAPYRDRGSPALVAARELQRNPNRDGG